MYGKYRPWLHAEHEALFGIKSVMNVFAHKASSIFLIGAFRDRFEHETFRAMHKFELILVSSGCVRADLEGSLAHLVGEISRNASQQALEAHSLMPAMQCVATDLGTDLQLLQKIYTPTVCKLSLIHLIPLTACNALSVRRAV